MRKQRMFTLDNEETLTAVEAFRDERNVYKLSEVTIRTRLYSGITDPERLWAKPNNFAQSYTLDAGEVLTVAEAVKDERNVYKIGYLTLRNRLNSGITDPEKLWKKPRNTRTENTEYVLSSGEKITPLDAVKDPRNVHHVSLGGMRSRLSRGVDTEDELFAEQWYEVRK